MFKDLKNLMESRSIYVGFSFIYFILGGIILGGTVLSYAIALALYLVSVSIALSQVAEKMLRFIYGMREIETNEERDYLVPIFIEVLSATLLKKSIPPITPFKSSPGQPSIMLFHAPIATITALKLHRK